MKLTHLILAGLGSAALFTMSTAKAQVFADWTFQSDSIATNDTPIADTGIDGQTANGGNNTAIANAIGMTNTFTEPGLGNSVNNDDVLAGATGDTGSNTLADTGNEWRVRAKASSPNNGNGWNSAAAIGTQGAQFFSSTAGTTPGNNAIKVSFDFYVTNQAESNMEFLYTTNNGATWNNLALTIPTSSAGFLTNETGSASDANTVNGAYVTATGGQDWFQGLSATITDASALNDSQFGIEMVNASTGADVLGASGGAYNNSSGNWRFDNVEIQGITATPEPSSWMLGLGAVAMFLAISRVRREASRR